LALTEIHTSDSHGIRRQHAPSGSSVTSRQDYRPESCDPALQLHVVTDMNSELWDRAEQFVYEVYRVSEFCGESPRRWVEESEPYRPGSRLHVLLDADDIVGVIRTFVGTYEQLPIGQFRPEVPVPDGTLIEIGSLAVKSSLRGLGVANELHRSAVQDAIRHGVPAFCMLVEPWAIDFFRDVYGVPLVQTAPAEKYMGSLTVPAIADIAATLQRLVTEFQALYEWLTEGLEAELWASGKLPILLR
jgi:hypothetical protein